MKLAQIQRSHLLEAAFILDSNNDSTWSEYWISIPELKKEYPFKLLVRTALEIALEEKLPVNYFESNENYRKYIQDKFNCKIYFKIRSNLPFFTLIELQYFSIYANASYRKDNLEHKIIANRLKSTVYAKTNAWVKALDIEGFQVEEDNNWQISGNFKPYTWARLYRKGEKDKKIFFTVGVEDECLVYKLDCQRRSYNPDKSLSERQVALFDRLLSDCDANWQALKGELLKHYDWEKFILKIRTFILYYIGLYDELVAAIWSHELNPIVEETEKSSGLTFREIDPLIGHEKIKDRAIKKVSGVPDYDGNNKVKKELGDAGEQLVIEHEKTYLLSEDKKELADRVRKVEDWEGYDILSFTKDGAEKHIEVKTTSGSIYRPFIISINEKTKMEQQSEKYLIYRLYNYNRDSNQADFFILKGNYFHQVIVEPLQFNIYLKKQIDNNN